MIASAERERWQASCSRVVGRDSPLESFKRIVRHARTMSERAMARSVVARQRFSRLFALGDRKSPISWSPALVIGSEDNDIIRIKINKKYFRPSEVDVLIGDSTKAQKLLK